MEQIKLLRMWRTTSRQRGCAAWAITSEWQSVCGGDNQCRDGTPRLSVFLTTVPLPNCGVSLTICLLHHATRLLHLPGIAGLGAAGPSVRLDSSLGAFPCQEVCSLRYCKQYRRRGSTAAAAVVLVLLAAPLPSRGRARAHTSTSSRFMAFCFACQLGSSLQHLQCFWLFQIEQVWYPGTSRKQPNLENTCSILE